MYRESRVSWVGQVGNESFMAKPGLPMRRTQRIEWSRAFVNTCVCYIDQGAHKRTFVMIAWNPSLKVASSCVMPKSTLSCQMLAACFPTLLQPRVMTSTTPPTGRMQQVGKLIGVCDLVDVKQVSSRSKSSTKSSCIHQLQISVTASMRAGRRQIQHETLSDQFSAMAVVFAAKQTENAWWGCWSTKWAQVGNGQRHQSSSVGVLYWDRTKVRK